MKIKKFKINASTGGGSVDRNVNPFNISRSKDDDDNDIHVDLRNFKNSKF